MKNKYQSDALAAIHEAAFAIHLNVSKGVVSQWERGEKQLAGTSLKLLALVQEKGLDTIA